MKKLKSKNGFTLIELSIVLVIVGLISGGVLLGRELIKAAELRALVSQADKYKVAAMAFKGKYNSLPGDMNPTDTTKFGFFTFIGPSAGVTSGSLSLGGYIGFGDNNGMIAGIPVLYCWGECGAFWRHLADAEMIEGNYGRDAVKPLEARTNVIQPGAPTGEHPDTILTQSL